MEDLAGLLIAERAWLGLYAEGGVVKALVDEAKAGEHMEAAERFEALWGACQVEAEAALAAFLPSKAG